MSTISVAKPPPTAVQAHTVRILASKIHYAFATRPPFGSPLRATWDDLFLRDVAPLLHLLNTATFTSLPTLAMGCVWAANCRLREVPRRPTLNIDIIQPVVGDHPALAKVLPKGMHHLTYEGDDVGPMGLLSEDALPDPSVHQSSLTPVGQNRAGEEEDQGNEVGESLRGRDDMDMSSATHEVEEAGAEALMSIDEALPVGATASAILNALSAIPSETVPASWIDHPARCVRCQAAGIQCYIHPLSTSVCAYCGRRKQKCSLTFNVSSQPLSGFLSWVYWKVVSHPNMFGQPVFTPQSFSAQQLPPISEPPEWFQRQFGAERPEFPGAGDALTPSAASSMKQSASRAPSASRPSTRSSKGKERAASPSPIHATVSVTPATHSSRAPRTRSSKQSSSMAASLAPSEPRAESATPRTTSTPSPSPSVSARKPRDRKQSKSTGGADAADQSLAVPPRGHQPGSSTAPIDIDAMDVDNVCTSNALRGRPIDTRGLGPALRVRGSEFAHKTTDGRERSPSPVRRAISPTEVQNVTVPPVEGSWRTIPRLDDVLMQRKVAGTAKSAGEHDLGDDPLPGTLEGLLPLADHGKTALPETELLKSNLFAVSGIIECTKNWVEILTKQASSVRDRSEQAVSDSLGRPQAEVLGIWFDESQALGEDVNKLSRQLADTNRWISLLVRCLKDLMGAPIQGDTLEAVLREVAQLKYAYKNAMRKFATLQENVRPLRKEVYRLRSRTDEVEITAEVAANEAARAIEPLLSNLYSQISAELDALLIAISMPMERMAASAAQHGAITPTVLQDVVGAIGDAVAEMKRTTTSIGEFIDRAWERLSSVLSARVQDLEARVSRMEGEGRIRARGEAGPSAGISVAQLAATVDSLNARVDALQRQVSDDAALDKRIQENLVRMGFTDAVLRRLFER